MRRTLQAIWVFMPGGGFAVPLALPQATSAYTAALLGSAQLAALPVFQAFSVSVAGVAAFIVIYLIQALLDTSPFVRSLHDGATAEVRHISGDWIEVYFGQKGLHLSPLRITVMGSGSGVLEGTSFRILDHDKIGGMIRIQHHATWRGTNMQNISAAHWTYRWQGTDDEQGAIMFPGGTAEFVFDDETSMSATGVFFDANGHRADFFKVRVPARLLRHLRIRRGLRSDQSRREFIERLITMKNPDGAVFTERLLFRADALAAQKRRGTNAQPFP